ncbi:MAG: hypothetical protein HY812_20960 [Planctomycetes bacterium]|nr:hypothetical protein [Planctomycetota bacterium]
MGGSRILLKALVLAAIAGLFVLPLTALRRHAGPLDALLSAEGGAGAGAALIADGRLAAGWQASPVQTYYPDAEAGPGRPPLADRIDGGDVLFYEYGFRRLHTRALEEQGGARLHLEEYAMADAAAAFGIWSLNRGPSDAPFPGPVLAAGGEDRAVLCHADRFLAVSAENLADTARLAEFVSRLAEVLRDSRPAEAAPAFPLAGVARVPGSEKLVFGPYGAQGLPVPAEVLGLSRGSPAWLFSVPSGADVVPALALAATPERARALALHFGAPAGSEEFEAGAAGARCSVLRRGDHLVIGCLIASDEELADFLKAVRE